GWLWLSLGSLAALLVLASLATVLLVRERGGRPGAAPPWTNRGRKALDLRWAEHPEFRWYLLSRFFVLVALGSIQAFAYYYLDDVVGVGSPARTAGYLAVIGGGMVLALAYPVGRLGDRWGRRTMLYSAGLISSLGVLGLLLSRSELQVLLSSAFLGVATCIFLVNSWALATDLVPAERAAHYLGLVNLAALGGVVARLWGPIIDLLNARQPGQGYTVLLLGCLVYIAMGTALLGLVRQSKAREGALL
ncbi:MAG: MFS transporter, partial [Chloroflexi bacterium]|nr:MFS transporter [Chloroflexota bacterium]